MSAPLEDGEEEGTSNNIYYLTTYTPITGERVKVHRQNRLCRPCWLNWTTEYPGWQNTNVLVQNTPGPACIGISDPKRGELVSMWDFLIKARVLPPRPNPIYATYGEIEGRPSELVQSIRDDLTKLRGKLHDLSIAYPMWRDWLKSPEGGISCVISTLYGAMQEMIAHQRRHGHTPDWLKPLQ